MRGYRVSIPTADDEEALEEDSLDRLARYAADPPRPVRDGLEPPARFQGFQPRRDRSDRQLQWGPVLAAAAAGFLIAITFGPRRSSNPLREEEFANLQSDLQSTRDRAAQLESELSAARESIGKADVPEPADASEHRAAEHEPQAAPEPKRESRSEQTTDKVLRKEPITNPEAAKATEPPAATTPTPISSPSPKASGTEAEQVALAEPQGSVSVYDVPDPAAPIVRSTSRSGTPGVAVLQVLAPERAGWTTEAQPTLYWHASERMQLPGEFALFLEGEDEPLVRGRLSASDGAGIQRIELSRSHISLDEGASYRWTVSFVDPAHSGTGLAIGGIRRVAPPETLRATDASSVPERLDALERAGLWYDALDLVTRTIEDNSGAKNLVARRNAMLARVGIHLPSS
jgi:hypothetical protein